MAIDEAKLQAFSLDEFLDAWERDGLALPSGMRAFPAGLRPTQIHPDAFDRIVAGPQHAFIRTMEAIMASRWRSAVGEMKETPAQDNTGRVPEIALMNSFGVRLFNKSSTRERVRFQDRVVLQRTSGNYDNAVEIAWTGEAAGEGVVSWGVRVKAVNPDGTIGDFMIPIVVNAQYNGAKVYHTKFVIGRFAIGTLLVIEITRNAALADDTLNAPVGLIAARVI